MFINISDEPHNKCKICLEMLANGNMKPSGQARNVKRLFLIFTVVFKVRVLKTTFTKLNNKKLEGIRDF